VRNMAGKLFVAKYFKADKAPDSTGR